MKLKRMIGVLLAMLVLASGAVLGARAAWAPGEAVTLAQSGGWQAAEVRWIVTGDKDEFFAENDAGTSNYYWTVEKIADNGTDDDTDDTRTMVPLEERRGVYLKELRKDGSVSLTLKAEPEKLYGQFLVSLSVNGSQSKPVVVWLLDDSDLQAAIKAAKTVAANPNDRYSADYIAALNQAIANANALYGQSDVRPGDISAAEEALRKLTAVPVLALTDNDFINNLVPGWWGFVDFISAPFLWLQNARWSNFFTILAQTFGTLFTF
jgi:hypothetical protein